jgi:hypothetical protein
MAGNNNGTLCNDVGPISATMRRIDQLLDKYDTPRPLLKADISQSDVQRLTQNMRQK